MRLFFLWAFATFFLAVFISFAVATLANSARKRSTSRRAYQTSRLRIVANSRIASRYARAVVRTAVRVSFGVKSRSRPAIAKLAARRLTSHSHGPGKRLVEVVDVQHQTAIGGGEDAEVREVGIAACLDPQPGLGGLREVHRHDRRGATKERERRGQHPPVADRHQLGHAGRGLVLEHVDRISPAAGRLPFPVARARDPLSRRLAGGCALLRRGSVYERGFGGSGGHVLPRFVAVTAM